MVSCSFVIAGFSEVSVVQKVYDLLKSLLISASLCRESGSFDGAGSSEDL
jgi:hypothetical protein